MILYRRKTLIKLFSQLLKIISVHNNNSQCVCSSHCDATVSRSIYLKSVLRSNLKEKSQFSFYRKLDGRPKLFLRRFFSSIGLNSVGRLVKGGRSSSMEQLSIPTAPRASSASPSPTRRPQPTIRIQRTPSLQTLNTVSKRSKCFVVLLTAALLYLMFLTS